MIPLDLSPPEGEGDGDRDLFFLEELMDSVDDFSSGFTSAAAPFSAVAT